MAHLPKFLWHTAPPKWRAAMLLLVARRMVPGQHLDFDVDMWVTSCVLKWRAYMPMLDFVTPGGLLIDLQAALADGRQHVNWLAAWPVEALEDAGWLREEYVRQAIDALLNPHFRRYIEGKVGGLTPDEAFARVMGGREAPEEGRQRKATVDAHQHGVQLALNL